MGLGTESIARVTTLTDILSGISHQPAPDTGSISPLVFPVGRAAAIAYMDNAFEPELCNEIIEYCQANYEKSKIGRTMGGINYKYKVTRDWNFQQIPPDQEPLTQEEFFDRQIFSRVWNVIETYKGTFPSLMMPDAHDYCMTHDTGYQIQKYSQNTGFYNAHMDGSPWVQNAFFRTLGVIVYLNTVSSGGGTGFPFHQTVIDAVQGRVSVFPAYWTHPHEGLMPLSSDKWIISTFVNCTNPTFNGNAQCTCGPQ